MATKNRRVQPGRRANADTYAKCHANSNPNGDTYGDTECYSDSYSNGDPEANADAADSSGTATSPDPAPKTVAGAPYSGSPVEEYQRARARIGLLMKHRGTIMTTAVIVSLNSLQPETLP
jgi:hypothetical protein